MTPRMVLLATWATACAANELPKCFFALKFFNEILFYK
jgi:hypothetical protein